MSSESESDRSKRAADDPAVSGQACIRLSEIELALGIITERKRRRRRSR